MILDHYIAIFVLPFLLLLYVVRKNRKARRLPPGPWQLPLLGYLPWIDAEKPHETLTRLSRVYGPVCGFRMGSVYTVLLSDPQLIRQSFAKDSITNRAPLYLTHGIMKGYGKYFPFSSPSIYIYTFFLAPRYNLRGGGTVEGSEEIYQQLSAKFRHGEARRSEAWQDGGTNIGCGERMRISRLNHI